MGYVIFLLEDTPNRRGRLYCYPPSEGLGEVVCPNKGGEDIQDIRNIRDIRHTQP